MIKFTCVILAAVAVLHVAQSQGFGGRQNNFERGQRGFGGGQNGRGQGGFGGGQNGRGQGGFGGGQNGRGQGGFGGGQNGRGQGGFGGGQNGRGQGGFGGDRPIRSTDLHSGIGEPRIPAVGGPGSFRGSGSERIQNGASGIHHGEFRGNN